jgi:Tfp pilus assembly protein PilF
LAAIFVVGVAVFANSFNGDLIFDDLGWITANPTIHHLGQLDRVLFPEHNGFDSGRPVLNLTLAVNYAISGNDPRSYHVVNIAIHILAGWTLFGIMRRTLLSPTLRERFGAAATPLALAVTLLWLVHPLQTGSVSYVIQRTEALVGLFYLLTLYCTIRGAESGHPRRWYAAAVAACFLGMGTKEVMATAPLIVLLYDRAFLSGSFAETFHRRWGLYLAMAATWGVVIWCLVSTGYHSGSAGFGSFAAGKDVPLNDKFGMVSYAMTQPGVILHYLRLTFWPVGQCLDYQWPASHWPNEVVGPGLAIVALLALTAFGLIINSPWGFLGAWFFIILAPTSSFVPIRDAAFEHRMYLPLAAISAIVVTGGFVVWRRFTLCGSEPHTEAGMGAWAWPSLSFAIAVVALSVATIRRNEVLGSGISAWENVLERNPDSARAHNNLAAMLIDAGRYDEAIGHCREALKLSPRYSDAENNLGQCLLLEGQKNEAEKCFRKALEFVPAHPRALQNLAKLLYDSKRPTEAADFFRRLTVAEPENAEGYFMIGNCVGEKDPKAAIGYYRRAIEILPDYGEAKTKLAQLEGAQASPSKK